MQQLTAFYTTANVEDASVHLNETIEFSLNNYDKGSASIFEIADYLLNNSYKKAGEDIIKLICNHAEDIQRCKSSQRHITTVIQTGSVAGIQAKQQINLTNAHIVNFAVA